MTSTSVNKIFSIILTVPRIAALRPAAAPAIIKSLIESRGKSATVLDINLDYHNNFRQANGEKIYWEIDDYFFNQHATLSQETEQIYKNWISSWVEKIKNYNPEWLMISVFTWQCQKFTRDFLTVWRSNNDIKVLIGGQGLIKEENGSYGSVPTFAHELKNQNLIDHWVRGEAESTIDYIINGDFDQPGIDTEFLAPRSDPNQHQYMNFDDFDILKYQSGYETGVLPMETSRGCIRNCMFCDIPTMHNGFRFKKGQRLLSEMLHYYEKYKVTDYFFHDALCNGSVKDFKIFNQGLIDFYQQQDLPMRFLKYSSHYIVRGEMKEDDYRLMGEAGAETMVIGVESGSDRIREHMKKGFTTQHLDYTMEMFSKYGINAYFLLIVGFPTETEEDFQATLDMLTKYQPYVADGTIIGVNLGTTLTIEEGTPIWTEYPKFNIVAHNNERPKGPDWMCKDNPSLTYKERILRRIKAQEHAVKLGYTFWKGDDQLKLLMDNYKDRLHRLAGVIH
jgi:hypothetical protein